MEDLCNQLLRCQITNKPKLYNMMIFDFADLSEQYNKSTEFTFNMNHAYELATSFDIQELVEYIQQFNAETTLEKMIEERYPNVFIDRRILFSMIDYYIECLCGAC